MKVKEIRDISQWDDYFYDWRNLQMQCEIDQPFLDWNWIRAWVERLQRDNLSPVLIVVQDKLGDVVGLAPFQVSRGILFKQIEGIAQEFCDYVDWLVAPTLEREVGKAITGWLEDARSCHMLIRIRNIFPEGAAYRILKRYFPDALEGHGIAPEVPIKGTFDEYLKTLNPKFINDTRRRERKLRREVGEVSYVLLHDNDEIANAVDIIAKWLNLRRGEKNGSSYLDRDGMKDHFIALYQKLNSLNMLHLSAFKVNEKYIAMNVAFDYQNRIFSYTPVFDPRYAKYAIMRLLKLKHIEECYHRGISTYDFCLGGEKYKFAFNPSVKQLYSFSLYGTNLQGMIFKLFKTKLKPEIAKNERLKKEIKKFLRQMKLLRK